MQNARECKVDGEQLGLPYTFVSKQCSKTSLLLLFKERQNIQLPLDDPFKFLPVNA